MKLDDINFVSICIKESTLVSRMQRKPMTILVVNNHGGAIFSLLPMAKRTTQKVLDQYFYTSHDVSIGKLCLAHG